MNDYLDERQLEEKFGGRLPNIEKDFFPPKIHT